jgi:hypothetical protein
MLTRASRFFVIGLFVALSSCGGDAANEAHMRRADLGTDWPLTVDEGTVSCEGIGERLGEVYFTAEGTTYAVNGLAQGASDGPDIDEIWADNLEMEGLKINIGPIIDRGLDLCG